MKQLNTVYISYSWAPASAEIAKEIEEVLTSKGINVKVDKKELEYKSDIMDFMEEIASGEKVIIIISEDYLKSDNCMRELVGLYKKGRLADRIYPLILPSTHIYQPEDKIKYLRYWERKAKDLEELLKDGNIAKANSLHEQLNLRIDIRNYIDTILETLTRINANSLKQHQEENYQSLIQALGINNNENNSTTETSPKSKKQDDEALYTNYEEGYRVYSSGKYEIIDSSVEFFSSRMRRAFAGQRGLVWYNNPIEAVSRLEVLLHEPISFDLSKDNREYDEPSKWIVGDPIWWWRGNSNLEIDSFKKLSHTKIVIGGDEYEINRIAAFRSNKHHTEFVYVETNSDKPTGLYNNHEEQINEIANDLGYYSEEFAVFEDKLIKREEYDDGYAFINGNITSVYGSELRQRYLTPYNFFIAAKFSGLNSRMFDRASNLALKNILKGTEQPEDLFKLIENLPKYNPNK